MLLGGCAGVFGHNKTTQLQPPAVIVSQTVFSGSPLSGPTASEVKTDSVPQVIASVQLLALRDFDSTSGKPIGASARLISANRGGATLQPTTSIIAGARVLTDAGAAERFSKLGDEQQVRSVPLPRLERRAILAGATTLNRVVLPEHRLLELSIYRPIDGASASVALTVVEAANDSKPMLRETAILDAIDLANQTQLLLVLPRTFEDSAAKAIAVYLELQVSGSNADYAPLLATAQEDLKQSSEIARSQPTTATMGSAASSGDQSSLEAIKYPARRRAALVYLSGETGAGWCEDFSLVADDANLEKLAAKINENLTPHTGQQRDLLGWVLDRSTLLLLSELASDTKNKIAPELSAVLTRHAGEAGRHDSSMEQIVKNLQSKADLENRIIAENFIYLEDNSPAARVRAYDFLKAKGKAPKGFDPLGPARERRAALEKANPN